MMANSGLWWLHVIFMIHLLEQHPEQPFPPSHQRGSQRIDFIFTTPGLAHALLHSGCLPLN
jgi:hypothetical protein